MKLKKILLATTLLLALAGCDDKTERKAPPVPDTPTFNHRLACGFECDDNTVAIVWSLENQADYWTMQYNTLSRGHNYDTAVWVGNGVDGVNIGTLAPGEDVLNIDRGYKPNTENRQAIWDAYQDWLRQYIARGLQ